MLKKAGCLLQINMLSLTKYYGMNVAKVSEKLIKNKLIDFIGSDIHNKKHISALDMKIKISSENLIEKIFEKNNEFG